VGWAYRSVQRLSVRSFAGQASGPLPEGAARAGRSSCALRPRESSPATSSRWRPSFSRRSTCCSSSRSAPEGCTSPAPPQTRTAPSSPSRRETSPSTVTMRRHPYASSSATAIRSSPVPCDEVFKTEGAKVILTPVRSPKANAFAERWVRTVRAELLDWTLVLGRRHLNRLLDTYVCHYNSHRPHRGLDLTAPNAPLLHPSAARTEDVRRRDVLSGLIHEYHAVAA
jgi:hypothetical protein